MNNMEFSVEKQAGKRDNDISKTVHKLKSTLMKMFQKDRQQVIETDFDHQEFEDTIDSDRLSDSPWYSTFEDPTNQEKCKEVSNFIEDGLKIARADKLKCEILIPCGLTMRIARDILIMSESEPCGIRGCTVFIKLQEKDFCRELVKYQCDPATVATFEIHLTLEEDTRGWAIMKKTFMSLTGCFKNSVYKATPKMLCLPYKLEKQKLYRASM